MLRRIKSDNPKITEDGSPIIYTVPVIDGSSVGDGPQPRPKKFGVAYVKGKNGVTYEIPVDKDGKVPTFAIFERFLDFQKGTRDGLGTRNPALDLRLQAVKMHEIPPGGFTPEEIINCGWWMYPAESDIKGVDDPSSVMNGEFELPSDAMTVASKIAILGPESERKRVQKVLKDNFTTKELKKAVEDQGIVISVAPAGPGASGWYMGKQKGVKTPQIVVEPGASEDTITHEFVHHLRRVDDTRGGISRCPFPLDEGGAIGDHYMTLPKSMQGTLTNIEEAATVAEATVRTRQPEPRPTGYYVHMPDGRENYPTWYAEDRDTMTKGSKSNRPQRGKRATARVNARFNDTHISGLRFKQGKSAKEGVAEMVARGILPEPAPQTPKSRRSRKGNVATAGGTGTGMPATATANEKRSMNGKGGRR